MASASLYPVALKEELEKQFVGKSLRHVPTPVAVLDLSKLKKNCKSMLDAVDSLKFGWRAHIKTHKTTELTRLQVGEGSGPVNIIVSTVMEAENIVPLLLEYKTTGRAINLLYAFPVTPNSVPRLQKVASDLGPHNLCLLIDHPAQLPSVFSISTPVSLFIKIDMGAARAGVIPQTEACSNLISQVLALEASSSTKLLGLYAHAGHSYYGTTQATALDYLRQEFESLLVTASALLSASPSHPLVLSVGATPTATSIRNLLLSETETSVEAWKECDALRATIQAIHDINCTIEIHAGVYPCLDIQQLTTHALPENLLQWDNLALTITCEVASLYPGRGVNGSTEALIGAGTLALGREPCQAYKGWGVLSPWNREGVSMPAEGPEEAKGWRVGRINQEHGILTWNAGKEEGEEEKLEVGQKVRVWPNHACVAGSGFGYYLVVDGGDEVVGVWPRWRGW